MEVPSRAASRGWKVGGEDTAMWACSLTEPPAPGSAYEMFPVSEEGHSLIETVRGGEEGGLLESSTRQ